MKKALIVISMLMFVGCAASMVWTKDGNIQRDDNPSFAMDKNQCFDEAEANLSYSWNWSSWIFATLPRLAQLEIDRDRLFAMCMRGKGYWKTN